MFLLHWFSMKFRQWIVGGVLLLLLAITVVGLLRTRTSPAPAEGEDSSTSAGSRVLKSAQRAPRSLVDQRPLQTARRLAAAAAFADEHALAHEAEKIADHEVDLAFYDAVRNAEENPPPLSPETKQLADRKSKAEAAIKEDQENVAQLTRRLAVAPESQKDNLQDQIDVAKAQMDLDQDELDDAAEDLEQAGGDPQSKIKRLKAAHDTSSQNPPPIGSAANPLEQDYESHTVLNVFRAWKALKDKDKNLDDARDEASGKAQRLGQRHDQLAAQVVKEKPNREAAKEQAKGFSKGTKVASREDSKAGAQAALASLKQYTHDQKNLADLARRVQDEKDLTDLYANWAVLVEGRIRAALHHLLECVLWMLLVLAVVYVICRLIDRFVGGMTTENKRIDALRSVLKFAVQVLGVIAIAFIIFGMPSQTTTILGLAGAGLTVASKDVIMAFFGWFLLMGRNGIRVGDWVEINGVGGEVVEIGLLKTVLLETGNWTDSSHPTGRRVSFVNSFAIEGHFFNFTTSGQWLWDEITLSLPSTQNPYPMMEAVQKLIVEETAKDARTAEDEWQRAAQKYRMHSFSAAPAINLRPTGGGIELHVRYITRAYERQTRRTQLYSAIVELMHHKAEIPAANATGA